jgi:8-oxo-dGTP pyrophosphatase MutT (NUDIX family)
MRLYLSLGGDVVSIVKFYRGDPKNAPKTTMPAHLGANVILTCNGKLLLEKRRDSDTWGLVGGGVKKYETELQAIAREIYEELGIRVKKEQLRKLGVYGEPGRIAAYQDGSVWRMVIVVFGLDLEEEPVLRISAESRELRFFSKEELKDIEIVITHSDIVEDHFLHI